VNPFRFLVLTWFLAISKFCSGWGKDVSDGAGAAWVVVFEWILGTVVLRAVDINTGSQLVHSIARASTWAIAVVYVLLVYLNFKYIVGQKRLRDHQELLRRMGLGGRVLTGILSFGVIGVALAYLLLTQPKLK
jgi:hypothetical protein